VNWYGYVNNRPLNLVDPSGLEPKSDPGFISDIGNANYTDIYLKQKQLESIEKERWEARIRKDEAHKRAGGKDLINGRGGKIAPPTGDYLDDRPSGPHEGIDIILGTADDKWHTAPGTPVYSEDNGVVIDCTKKSGAPGGYTIWIKSDQNALAPEEDLFYIHVAPLSILSKGDHIVRGELIGYISGEYNWHLHFQIGEKHKTKSPYLFFEKIGKEDE